MYDKNLLQELLNDEAFEAEIRDVHTPEELQALFASKGLEMSLEEVEALCSQAAAAVGGAEGELDEQALENVAGGFFISGTAFLAGSVMYAIAAIGSAYTLRKTCGGGRSKSRR